jgi:hypothetical protein
MAIWSGAHGGGEDARGRSIGEIAGEISLLLDNCIPLSVIRVISDKSTHNLNEVAFTARTLKTAVSARPLMLALIAVNPLAVNPSWV